MANILPSTSSIINCAFTIFLVGFSQSIASTLCKTISTAGGIIQEDTNKTKNKNKIKLENHEQRKTFSNGICNERRISERKIIEVYIYPIYVWASRNNKSSSFECIGSFFSNDPLLLSIKLFTHLILSVSFTIGQGKRLKSNIIHKKKNFWLLNFVSLFLSGR